MAVKIEVTAQNIKIEPLGTVLDPSVLRALELVQHTLWREEASQAKRIQERIEVLKENFECRTGHSVHSTCHREWQNEENYRFLVCAKTIPNVKLISENSQMTWITLEGHSEQDLDELSEQNLIIGWGATEEEAWNIALS